MADEAKQRGRGRPASLTPILIADAALEMVAATSANELTMQRVAQRLGVRHSALYRHVSDRQDLLRLVADRHIELLGVPDPDGFVDWRACLVAVWERLDAGCARYPGLAEAVYASVWPPPQQSVRAGLHVARCLVEHWGFPESLAMLTADLVLDFAVDARSRVDRILALSPGWDGFGDAFENDASSDKSAFEAHLALGPTAWTRSKLEVILDGIDKRAASISDKM